MVGRGKGRAWRCQGPERVEIPEEHAQQEPWSWRAAATIGGWRSRRTRESAMNIHNDPSFLSPSDPMPVPQQPNPPGSQPAREPGRYSLQGQWHRTATGGDRTEG